MTIPSTVTEIGQAAFAGCNSLNSTTIPGAVTAIGHGAFADCSRLTSIYYNSENPIEVSEEFGGRVFSGCPEDATLYVPEVSVEICKTISPWNYFRNIQAFDFSGLEKISTDFNEQLPYAIFNLNGVEVGYHLDSLVSGIYIICKGNTMRKIKVK